LILFYCVQTNGNPNEVLVESRRRSSGWEQVGEVSAAVQGFVYFPFAERAGYDATHLSMFLYIKAEQGRERL
jgi:hypothetical protein